ncbi:hypothetical protein [Candidatus Spongiihabitans sp.]|uniref:hypothetical protein n=1 Tax=Candidatus Spongiihabitans sp. TaxID=3101308 RepID=UPI003C7BBA80
MRASSADESCGASRVIIKSGNDGRVATAIVVTRHLYVAFTLPGGDGTRFQGRY